MAFYKAAFGAVEVYRFGGTDDLQEVVAQLAVGNSLFWVEDESPRPISPVGGEHGWRLGRIDDPFGHRWGDRGAGQRLATFGGSEHRPVVSHMKGA